MATQQVTPWETKCERNGFDYQKLVEEFGCQKLHTDLIQRFEKITGHPAHQLLKRGLFFAHRDFDKIVTELEVSKKEGRKPNIFLYTGRGPSTNSLHLGHIIPFLFIKWLHDIIPDSRVMIQMADEEKSHFKNVPFDEIRQMSRNNARDIAACGFDANRTYIYSNYNHRSKPGPKEVIQTLNQHTRMIELKAIFGLTDEANVGMIDWPISQTAAAFSTYYGPTRALCLVVYAIDQDPYFRLARDKAKYLKCPKPTALITKFLPALKGDEKMSSSSENPTIYLDDTPKQVENKIRNYAFSGGKDTLEEHKKYGADLNVDVCYQYLQYFMQDSEMLDTVSNLYKRGEMGTGEFKKITSATINTAIQRHQEAKTAITDTLLDQYFQPK